MSSTTLGQGGPNTSTSSAPTFLADVAIGSGEPWAPYMDLVELIDKILVSPSGEDIETLRTILGERQGNLRSLTTSRPKNGTEREQLKKSIVDPVGFRGHDQPQTLPVGIVNEAQLVSDLLDISEFYALDLLITGDLEAGSFPSWSRGLIAIYIYYEGWFSLLSAVNSLIYITPGLTWGSRVSSKLLGVCKPFIEGLTRSNVIDKAIDLLGRFDVKSQTELLDSNLALGDWRHRTEVTSYMVKIRVELSRIIFGILAQEKIGWKDTMRILEYLRTKIIWKPDTKQERMSKDDSILVVAIFYTLDNNLTGEEYDKQFAVEFKKYIADAETARSFQCPELLELFKFAYHTVVYRIIAETTVNLSGTSITSRGLSGVQAAQDLLGDEDLEFATNIFAFLGAGVLASEDTLKEEQHFMRRVHILFTDFINHIPMKLKESKSRAEDSARTAAWYLEQGLALPSNLSVEYETFLYVMGYFYGMDTDYKLGEDYFNTDPQHVALSKFIRSLCSDSPSMFVCNANVLVGLALSYAPGVMSLVKQSGHNMSLDHFFESILKHLNTFGTRVSSGPTFSNDAYQRVIMDPLKAGLKPQEVNGIRAVLQIIQNLCTDNFNQLFFVENKKQWIEVLIATTKIRALPRELRTEMFRTVAGMIPVKDASHEAIACLWETFANSKLIEYGTGDLRDELEEKETRLESYMLTIGFLKFFDALLKASKGYSLDDTLYAEIRGNQALLEPYVYYVRDSVLLKISYRSYKDPNERWELLSTSISIITNLLDDVPSLMIQLVSDSPLIRMIFSFLYDCTKVREMSTGSITLIDNTSWEILNLIYQVAIRQDKYLLRKSQVKHDAILIGIHDLILTINPESGRAEYLLSIIKFIDKYNPPKHREISLELLTTIISGHGEIDVHLYCGVTSDSVLADVLRNTFCESLCDRKCPPPVKKNILQLLRSSIVHASPNFGMFLLGVDKKIEFDHMTPTGKWTSILHPLLNNNSSLPDVFLTLLVLIRDLRLRDPLLRYLRSIQYFVKFYRDEFPTGMELEAIGHFLRCLSMELKTSQTVGQLAHALVVHDSNKFLSILGNLDLNLEHIEFPVVDYFEPSHVNEALKECEYLDKEYRVRLIDTKKLETMFDEEIAKLEKNTALRLRKSVAAEAKDLIVYACKLNEIRKTEASKLSLFYCWKQCLEVLILTPGTLKLAGMDFVTSTLRLVMDKISETDTTSESFQRLAAETVLSLCGVLGKFAEDLSETMLNLILSSLCNWASKEIVPSVRAMLYPSILSVLRIINQQHKMITSSTMIGVLVDGLCKDCLHSGDVGKITSLILLGEIIFWSTRNGLGGIASSKGTSMAFGPGLSSTREGLYKTTRSEASFSATSSEYSAKSPAPYHQVGSFGDISHLPRDQTNKDFQNNSSYPRDVTNISYLGHGSGDTSGFNKIGTKRRIGDTLSRAESVITDDGNSSVFSYGSNYQMNSHPTRNALNNILYSRGLLRNIVDDLLHTDDKALIELFSSIPGSAPIRPLFLFEAKMHLLSKYAESGPNATQELLDNNLILKLSDMRVFRMLSAFNSRDPLAKRSMIENENSTDPIIKEEANQLPNVEAIFVAVLTLFNSLDLKGERQSVVGSQVWHFINVNERSFESLTSSYPIDPQLPCNLSLFLFTTLIAKIGQHVPQAAIDPRSYLMSKITYCLKMQASTNGFSTDQIRLTRDLFNFIYDYCTNVEALEGFKYNGENASCRALFSPRMDYTYRNLGIDEELTIGTILKLTEMSSSRIPNWDGDKTILRNLISITEIGLLLSYWHTEEYLRAYQSKTSRNEKIHGFKTYQQLLATHLEESLIKNASDAAECTSSKDFIIGILIRLRRLAHLDA